MDTSAIKRRVRREKLVFLQLYYELTVRGRPVCSLLLTTSTPDQHSVFRVSYDTRFLQCLSKKHFRNDLRHWPGRRRNLLILLSCFTLPGYLSAIMNQNHTVRKIMTKGRNQHGGSLTTPFQTLLLKHCGREESNNRPHRIRADKIVKDGKTVNRQTSLSSLLAGLSRHNSKSIGVKIRRRNDSPGPRV